MEVQRTTEATYGSIARWLHWTTAGGFLALYCIIYGRNWFLDEDSVAGLTALQVHQLIGLSTLILVAWRIAWRLNTTTPGPLPAPRYTHWASGATHLVLYCILVAMPVSGYLYASNSTNVLGLFSIPAFGDTAPCHWLVNTFDLSLKSDIRPVNRFLHRELFGPLVLPVLIGIHVMAALYHHYILRDATLTRMLLTPEGNNQVPTTTDPDTSD